MVMLHGFGKDCKEVWCPGAKSACGPYMFSGKFLSHSLQRLCRLTNKFDVCTQLFRIFVLTDIYTPGLGIIKASFASALDFSVYLCFAHIYVCASANIQTSLMFALSFFVYLPNILHTDFDWRACWAGGSGVTG